MEVQVGRHQQLRLIAEGHIRETSRADRTADERLTQEYIESDGRYSNRGRLFSRRSDSQERFLTIAEKSESYGNVVKNREVKK